MRILIVEDEVMIREGLSNLIKIHTGHTVIGEACNGQEGLALAVRYRPELVITDIRMPVMDGLQMIEKFHEMNLFVHVVILSGYSEFEYAKKAIRFGVEDYLLKPLAAEDIVEVLERIRNKLEDEEEKNADTPEQYIRELLYGGRQSEEKSSRMKLSCGFGTAQYYQLYLGYFGDGSVAYEEEIHEKLNQLKNAVPRSILHVAADKTRRRLICLAGLPDMAETPHLLRQLAERRIVRPYKKKNDRAVWAMTETGSWEDMAYAAEKAGMLIKESMSLTEGELITSAHLEEVKWKEFHFPSDIVTDIKNAICKGRLEDIREAGERFIRYMEDGPYREPEMRQAYLKSIYLLLDTTREIDADTFSLLQNEDLLTRCTEAVTLRELEQSFRDGLALLCNPQRKREDISNYTIKRAINYIREHYKEGISLEEVSGSLGITPEYLSTLFNREMGENFSAFLKKFRLSHAKRLLKGTDMKIYEIAEAVGYTDSKYFARVFKDEFGISPVDYRQMD